MTAAGPISASPALPPRDGGAVQPWRAETMVELPGAFFENLVELGCAIYLTDAHSGRVLRWRDSESRLAEVARLPGMAHGILVWRGALIVGGRTPGAPETLHRVTSDGAVEQVAEIAGAGLLNGLALLDDGHVLAADSKAGGL